MTQPPSAWRHTLPAALLLMAPFDILASLAMDIYLPVVPAMPGLLDTTPDVIQLTLSLYMALLGVGQMIFGPISDRLGRRPVLLAGGAIFAMASLGAAFSDTATPFVTFRLLQAFGASAMLVATFATIRDVYARRPEGTVIYGLLSAALAFVPTLGPIVGAVVGRYLGWRMIFVLLAVLALVALMHACMRWHETRPEPRAEASRSLSSILESLDFWVYTLGFSAGMGSFFVFFSTAPRMLMDRAGYSGIEFSLTFSSVALVMVLTTRCIRSFVTQWGNVGCVLRGMALLIGGALLLSVGELCWEPSFFTLIVPMWVMAIGIVCTVSVTANGALGAFDDIAGTAVALYFCIQSLIVSFAGTLSIILLNGDTAWPLICYATTMALLVSAGLVLLRLRDAVAKGSTPD